MHADLLLLLVVLYPNIVYNCKVDIVLLLACDTLYHIQNFESIFIVMNTD